MRVRLTIAAFAIALTAALLGAYAILQGMFHGSLQRVATAQECSPSSPETAGNPNKLLFISCGGFLD